MDKERENYASRVLKWFEGAVRMSKTLPTIFEVDEEAAAAQEPALVNRSMSEPLLKYSWAGIDEGEEAAAAAPLPNPVDKDKGRADFLDDLRARSVQTVEVKPIIPGAFAEMAADYEKAKKAGTRRRRHTKE